jgi:hypothetical protein
VLLDLLGFGLVRPDLERDLDPSDLETVLVKPKKGGLELRLVAVLWRPG